MDWKKIVGTVAPWIATALGGPLAGAATKVVAEAIGLGSDASDEQLAATLAGATPDQLLALKNADQEFQLRMQELGLKNLETLAALDVENTKDARALQRETRSKIPAVLATIITLGFFGILAGMMTGHLHPTEQQAMLIMLGALGAAWGSVVNFYFGSSNSSQNKDALIYRSKSID